MEKATDFIDIYSTSPELAAGLQGTFDIHLLKDLGDVRNKIFSESYSLLLVDQKFSPANIKQLVDEFSPALAHRLMILYCGSGFVVEEILALADIPSVHKIIDLHTEKPLLESEIRSSVQVFAQKRETEDILGKVRMQNKMLNELNDNLGQIIRQRTEHLEKSKQEIEDKLKEVRELIRFIKSLSTIDAFEDLILVLRHEFLKYHKVRTPLIIYSLEKEIYRCLYFQGQQIVDQGLPIEPGVLWAKNPAKLREILADTLARPVSPVICVFLDHPEHDGVLIFEHSMDQLEQQAFMQLLERRIESLKTAFDRLSLKWKAHQISKQWSTTFDFLQDPIVIINQDYQVIRSNKVYARHQGHTCHKTFADKDSICIGCPVKEARAKKEAHFGKISVDDRIYEVHAYPIHLNNQDRFFNMIVHYTDITQATNLQGQLIQSEKMAAIGLLAGNIAHELNNPLTGIRSLAQILLSEIQTEGELKSDLQEIQAAAGRSEQIIKNLLEFSSFHHQDMGAVSVGALIHKTLPFLKTALRYHNSIIELSEGDDLVMIEPHLLQQVVFNLVNNACQAMGDTGDLYLTSRIFHDAVEISVRDTGPGIPKDIREAIFTPFFTTKEEGKGTGLGLSLSRAIIEKFGGQLMLREDLEEGSEFVIRLPKVSK